MLLMYLNTVNPLISPPEAYLFQVRLTRGVLNADRGLNGKRGLI